MGDLGVCGMLRPSEVTDRLSVDVPLVSAVDVRLVTERLRFVLVVPNASPLLV